LRLAAVRWDRFRRSSMLWRYFASRDFDASKPYGGDMMKALGRIKAPVLLLPSMTDRTIPGYYRRSEMAPLVRSGGRHLTQSAQSGAQSAQRRIS